MILAKKDYFPFSVGTKWLYSITITSSYTGKDYEKRLMVTNVSSEQKGDITQVSKIAISDGSYYTYEINKKKIKLSDHQLFLFAEGMVEPQKKNYLSRFKFQKNEWIIKEQLFLIQGFQPPLLNVKPRSRFDMRYKILKRLDNVNIKGEKL